MIAAAIATVKQIFETEGRTDYSQENALAYLAEHHVVNPNNRDPRYIGVGSLKWNTNVIPAKKKSYQRYEERHKTPLFESLKIESMLSKNRGEGITVAILDYGINQNSAFIKDRLLDVKDFTGSSGTSDGSANTGTQIASFISGY